MKICKSFSIDQQLSTGLHSTTSASKRIPHVIADPQQTTAGTSTPIGINLHHPQQQLSSQPCTPPLITGYLEPSDDDNTESYLEDLSSDDDKSDDVESEIYLPDTSSEDDDDTESD
uniref:Uncharacterized protein n=1 Tax=Meloidogyne enterolobii TaxID=390850 RepID=A0A6V7UJG8_MELEN|nr:unnamed protein product [Meloidogyne enterolobii]